LKIELGKLLDRFSRISIELGWW